MPSVGHDAVVIRDKLRNSRANSMSVAQHSEAKARSLLAFGGTASLIGIGFSASGSQELGSWIAVLGMLLLIYSLHSFGRSGPD